MSMSDMHMEVTDRLLSGETPFKIATSMNIPLHWVMAVDADLSNTEPEIDYSAEEEDYADAHALASIGWGTDEDYGADIEF